MSSAAPRRYRTPRTLLTLLAVTGLLTAGLAGSAGGAAGGPAGGPAGGRPLRVARDLSPSGSATLVKNSSWLAQTDQKLLGLTGTASKSVMVKLAVDALATYPGDAAGRGATSPSVTGRALNLRAGEVRAQSARIATAEQQFRAALARSVPGAVVGRSYRVVYGGVSVRLPQNGIKALAALPGVVAVQDDVLAQPLAVSDEARYIGAPAVYDELGSSTTAGAGVLIADLDTGVWPEHPSFDSRPDLPAAPTRPDGTAIACDYGDNPLTPAYDPYVCNNKLVGGQPFLDTYNSVVGDALYPGAARDDEGHGTHTTSTAGGNPLATAKLFGVDRGPVQGIAPGAQLVQYRVCGPQGCFSSDSTAAVEQAVLDGADVLNFSISGGTSPFSDPVELAFLDAYAAGVFVSASAGNNGPTAGTANHLSPWVTTVAASTQSRSFTSTLTLRGGGESLSVSGASIMGGVGSFPVVPATSVPGLDELCLTPAPARSLVGKIVICGRGTNGRVQKGYNVAQGGAEGMILTNPEVQDVGTDNHFLPTVQLDAPQAEQMFAFLKKNKGAVGSFTAGVRTYGRGDTMAAFSSRGPAGGFLKPDVTSTGVQVLAGNSPTPAAADAVPGTLFQAIAGTSMSAPHVTGAAALVKALHPTWTPGQIKSALATTADQTVVKEDGVTKADPFDFGSGRVDMTAAGNPGLTFDAPAAAMTRLGADPATQVDLNLPSVYAPVVPGKLTTKRTAVNVTNRPLTFAVSARGAGGGTVSVEPSSFTVAPGKSASVVITMSTTRLAEGTTTFGQVDLSSAAGYNLRLPVVFTAGPAPALSVATDCPQDSVPAGGATTCNVKVVNNALQEAAVSARTYVGSNLAVTRATSPATVSGGQAVATATLAARQPDAPGIADGSSPAGFLDLAGFGTPPTPIGDEAVLNFNVPQFVYHGQPHTSLGVTSNGYLVAGGAQPSDVDFQPQTVPDPAAPNDVLAPFWSDLDGTGDAGVRVTTLTDGVKTWIVVQADEHVYGQPKNAVRYQVWLGVNGTEDISFAYDPNRPITPDPAIPYVVGAENADGSAGETYPGLPAGDVVVSSTPGAPGGALSYSVTLKADSPAGRRDGRVWTEARSPAVRGRTIVRDVVRITG